MIKADIFTTLLIAPILNILVLFYSIFIFIKIPGAFGWSIIALTIFIRLLLHPFFKQQIHTQKKMQDLKPHLDKLQLKHKEDKKKLQEEQLRLYKDAGVNPAMGCLFLIIQLPIFIGLYNTLNIFLHHASSTAAVAEINKLIYFPALHVKFLDPNFFGLNLALTPQKGGLWFYFLIPVITGILQFAQASATIPSTPKTTEIEKKKKDKGADDKEKKPDTQQDFQKALNMQMKYFFPIMIGYFSFTLPVGLSLYWNIFSIFSIMQYRKLHSNNTK